jgi:hypothetical protein
MENREEHTQHLRTYCARHIKLNGFLKIKWHLISHG